MGQLDKLEMTLDDALNKKSPVKLPSDGRKMLASSMWWLALIFGLLQLWLAWDLWHLGHIADEAIDYVNTLSRAYGGKDVVNGSSLGVMYYLSLLVLVVDAALLLLAAPGLKAMRKAGWNLVFYSLLLNVVYGVFVTFSDVRGGIGELLWSLVGSVIGAFLLFQVRDYFIMSRPAEHHAGAHHK